ncbi:unnamed protein product [Prunus armeniaca]
MGRASPARTSPAPLNEVWHGTSTNSNGPCSAWYENLGQARIKNEVQWTGQAHGPTLAKLGPSPLQARPT